VALDPALTRQSLCYLETTGRVTGQPRLIEIWFAADPGRDRIYLLSGGRDRAHWVRNLRRKPAVRVRIGGRTFAGRAVEIEGGPDDSLARQLLVEKYEGADEPGSLSQWGRESLPVAIDLGPESYTTSKFDIMPMSSCSSLWQCMRYSPR
jgi:deazaflavin-dependent oxidoreductase (nitroreductase family)